MLRRKIKNYSNKASLIFFNSTKKAQLKQKVIRSDITILKFDKLLKLNGSFNLRGRLNKYPFE